VDSGLHNSTTDISFEGEAGMSEPGSEGVCSVCFEPPEDIAREFGYRPRQRRKITAEALHLSRWMELKIVREIRAIVE